MEFHQVIHYILIALAGYLSGSVLYGRLLPLWMKGVDVRTLSDDRNPGTFNAFHYGGFLCGVLTLCADLLKGAIPVAYCVNRYGTASPFFALVLAAPVWGHAFSIFYPVTDAEAIADASLLSQKSFPLISKNFLFKNPSVSGEVSENDLPAKKKQFSSIHLALRHSGGKAIAVSFGVLIGLLPWHFTVFLLVFYYLLFSLVLRIKSHSIRSICTFSCFMLTCFFMEKEPSILIGCAILSLTVVYKHILADLSLKNATDASQQPDPVAETTIQPSIADIKENNCDTN